MESNGTLFFPAFELVTGCELWKTDGTEAGTIRVKDISPGSASSSPLLAADFGGAALFYASEPVTGRELWRSDGTEAGTVILKDILPGSGRPAFGTTFAELGGMLFFNADDGVHGAELWRTDGTEGGTLMVKDVNPGPNHAFSEGLVTAIAFGEALFFSANDGTHGVELWRSDGTESGTFLVTDALPGPLDSYPLDLTAVNCTLFFRAKNQQDGWDLWKSDGTAAGTVVVLSVPSNIASELTPVGDTLFFTLFDGGDGSSALWESDGTESGTTSVGDMVLGLHDRLVGCLAEVEGRLLFSTVDFEGTGEVWRSDGSGEGTVKVQSIGIGRINPFPPCGFKVTGEVAFFNADDGTTGVELWAGRAALLAGRFAEAIGDLWEDLENLELPRGLKTSLESQLIAAEQDVLSTGGGGHAAHLLEAFIHKVEAQEGKNISEEDAAALIEFAEQIVASLPEE